MDSLPQQNMKLAPSPDTITAFPTPSTATVTLSVWERGVSGKLVERELAAIHLDTLDTLETEPSQLTPPL